MLATGNSQLVFLAELVEHTDVDWSRVTAFHMDEYVGLPPTHSASFQRYMREQVAAHAPVQGVPLPQRRHRRRGGRGRPLRGAPPCASARPLCLRDRRERPPRVQRSAGRRLRRPGRREDRRARARVAPPAGRRGSLRDDRRRADARDHRHDPRARPRRGACSRSCPRRARRSRCATRCTGPITTACPASFLRRQPHATLYLDADSASLLDP